MIRIYKQRDYRLQKVKVIESIFVEFEVNFQNSTLHNQHQVCLPRLVEFTKNTHAFQGFPLILVLPGRNFTSILLLLDRNLYSD